jgi:membrane protease YdiL (CAAX protease family)
VPILWIRKRYGYTKEALGLRRGNLRYLTSAMIGGAAALAYYLLVRLVLFPYATHLDSRPSYLALLLVPFSITGFSSIILGPISEEVLVRGFFYTYLREAFGRGPALVLQAFLFSALHLRSSPHSSAHVAIDAFLIGLMLGILYEKTGSLYAPIFCHSTVNYLAVFRGAL